MVQLLNNAESQASGTTVTLANSVGIDSHPWDEAPIGANMTMTYDNAHPSHGANSIKIALTSTATAITYVGWTSASWGAATTRMFGGFGFYVDAAAITSTIRLVGFYSGASTLIGYLGCNNGFAGFQFRSSADAIIGTVAGTIATATMYRVEFDVAFGASVAGTVNVYAGDSTSVLHTGGFTATSFGTTCDHIRFGCVTAVFSATSGAAFRFDDININDVGLPGPAPYYYQVPNLAMAAAVT